MRNFTTVIFPFSLPLLFVFLFVLFSSCQSITAQDVDNTDNPSVKMSIVREMIAQRRYKIARDMFVKIRAEFPSDIALLIEIDYEDAYIDFVKKNYVFAKKKFENILAIYEQNPQNQLPQWPYYLSRKLINKNIDPILQKKEDRKQRREERRAQKQEKNNTPS